MTILELFKDGKKVAEIDVTCLSFRQIVGLMKVQVEVFGRKARLRNPEADEISEEDLSTAGEYWNRLVSAKTYKREVDL